MPEPSPEELIVRVPRARTVGLLVGCVAFVLAGLWIAGVFGEGPGLWRIPGVFGSMLGGLCVGVFGLAALLIAPRLVRPVLVLDRAGFTDRASVAAVGQVHWSEVRDAGIVGHAAAQTLTMSLRDPEQVLARLSPSVRRRVEGQRRRTGGEVNIPVRDLDIEPEALLARVNAHLGQSS